MIRRPPKFPLPATSFPKTPLFLAYGNGRISKIEDQKGPPFADLKIGKIHHIAKAHPIEDIAKRAAQHEPKREDVAACLFPPHPNRNETSDDGGQANQHPSHGIGIGAEKAHRHAEVADKMKVEKG